MEEKASNAMLVAIVAVVAIVGLVMLYSGGSLSRGDLSITGQSHTGVACADSDGGSMPNVAGAVHVGETWTSDVCYTFSPPSIYEGTCSGGVMRRTVVPCEAGKTCVSETITAFGRSLVAQRCAVSVEGGEICNNIDDDRDGVVDEGCDDDNDDYCDARLQKAAGVLVSTCTRTPQAAARGDDCNDVSVTVHPGAAEVCGNGVDEDCNGVDLACPLPGGAPETTCDNIDNDVDGFVDDGCDDDDDNFCDAAIRIVGSPGTCTDGGEDCNDANFRINPRALEICGNGVDENCNSMEDDVCPPASPEICDNIDNDADGLIDEGCDDDNDNYCDAAIRVIGYPTTCTSGGEDCNDNNVAVHPWASDVTCDGVDQNCDGSDGIINRDDCNGRDDNCDGTVDGTTSTPNTCPQCADGDGGNNPGEGSFVVMDYYWWTGDHYELAFGSNRYDYCSPVINLSMGGNITPILQEHICIPMFRGMRDSITVINCTTLGQSCISAPAGSYCG